MYSMSSWTDRPVYKIISYLTDASIRVEWCQSDHMYFIVYTNNKEILVNKIKNMESNALSYGHHIKFGNSKKI